MVLRVLRRLQLYDRCTPAAAYINGFSHIFALNTGRTAQGRPPPGTGAAITHFSAEPV